MSVLLLCVILCTAAQASAAESGDTSAKQLCSAGESFQQPLLQGSVRSFLQHVSGSQGWEPPDIRSFLLDSSSHQEQLELFDVGTLQDGSSQQGQVQSDVENATAEERAMLNEKKHEIGKFGDLTKWGRTLRSVSESAKDIESMKMHEHGTHKRMNQKVVKFQEVTTAKDASDTENAHMHKHAKQHEKNREVVQEKGERKRASKNAIKQTKDTLDAMIHEDAVRYDKTSEAVKIHKLTKGDHTSKYASKEAEDFVIYEHTKQSRDKMKLKMAARGKQTSSSDAKRNKKKEQALKSPGLTRGNHTTIGAGKQEEKKKAVVKFQEVAMGKQISNSAGKDARHSKDMKIDERARQNEKKRHVEKVQHAAKTQRVSKNATKEFRDMDHAKIHKHAMHNKTLDVKIDELGRQNEKKKQVAKGQPVAKTKRVSKNATKEIGDMDHGKRHKPAMHNKKTEEITKSQEVTRSSHSFENATKDVKHVENVKIHEPAMHNDESDEEVKLQNVAKGNHIANNASKTAQKFASGKADEPNAEIKAKAKSRANQSKPHKKVGELGKSVVEQAVATDIAVVWVMVSMGIILLAWLLYCKHKESTNEEEIVNQHYSLYELNAQGKIHVYQGKKLLTWGMMLSATLSTILSWRVWAVVPCVICLAWAISTLVITQLPYANQLPTERMDSFAGYLRVFIAFMLGLYMNTSFQRWWHVVTSLKMIMASFKQLIWTLHLMNLNKGLTEDIERKCVVECYILEAEMHTDLSMSEVDCVGHFEHTWKLLIDEGLLTEKEVRRLAREIDSDHLITNIGARSSLMMSWIGHAISRISEEPGVLTPMFVRIVSLIHSAMSHAEDLKTCATVQVPFTYAYLLSMLVHLQNILLAVSSGFSFASAIEDVKAARREAAQDDSRSETMRAIAVIYKAFEVLWTQMTILVLIPLMYQSFLGIAHVLNRPFGNKIYHIPSETFIQILREELQIMNGGFKQERWNRKQKSSLSVLPEDSDDDALECGDALHEDEGEQCEDGV